MTKHMIIKLFKPIYQQIYKVSPQGAVLIHDMLKVIYSTSKTYTYYLMRKAKNDTRPFLQRNVPSVLVDVTNTTNNDLGTGIQRVVNSIYDNLKETRKDVISIYNDYGILVTNNRYDARKNKTKENIPEQRLEFIKGDKVLLLDSSWEFYKDFSALVDTATKAGAYCFSVVYDMFPIQYPELFDSATFISAFRHWHNMILQKTDAVVCISKTTADIVIQYYKQMEFKRNRPLKIFYFHMGANVPAGNMTVRNNIFQFVKKKKTFLMVGTLEPRKGHMVVMQAFLNLIKFKKLDCQLLIIGHNGWKNNEIQHKLELPELKEKVLWVQDASDEELRWAYAHSTALIAASKDEGFGLPLIEASFFGLPIICSDIPIFREVTQGYADYFKAMDAEDLADCICDWLKKKMHPDSRKIRIYTWQDAAKEVSDIINGNTEPYKVLD